MMAIKNVSLCAICGEAAIEKRIMTQQFAYASGARDVLLTADIPVEHCSSCGETLAGENAEIVRHEAVCRYLGRLTPREIKLIRKSRDETQKDFANELDVGLASLKRWETGANIQGKIHDLKIRKFSSNREDQAKRFTPVFRTPMKDYMIIAAERFELRPRG
jgi:YgiT-type zinc finger domain-containing protein